MSYSPQPALAEFAALAPPSSIIETSRLKLTHYRESGFPASPARIAAAFCWQKATRIVAFCKQIGRVQLSGPPLTGDVGVRKSERHPRESFQGTTLRAEVSKRWRAMLRADLLNSLCATFGAMADKADES